MESLAQSNSEKFDVFCANHREIVVLSKRARIDIIAAARIIRMPPGELQHLSKVYVADVTKACLDRIQLYLRSEYSIEIEDDQLVRIFRVQFPGCQIFLDKRKSVLREIRREKRKRWKEQQEHLKSLNQQSQAVDLIKLAQDPDSFQAVLQLKQTE